MPETGRISRIEAGSWRRETGGASRGVAGAPALLLAFALFFPHGRGPEPWRGPFFASHEFGTSYPSALDGTGAGWPPGGAPLVPTKPQESAVTAPIAETAPDPSSVAREASRLNAVLARDLSIRDGILERLKRPAERGLIGRLHGSWERRRMRGTLEEVVARLEAEQARFLDVEAQREGLAGVAAEQDWQRLQTLVSEAAASWREGRAEQPGLEPAISAALQRVEGSDAALFTIERYRALVARLARVNAIIERQESRVAETSRDSLVSASAANSARSAQAPGPAGFLGITDRGSAIEPPREASLEAWKRLRSGLAREIVSTASEITRRARYSS